MAADTPPDAPHDRAAPAAPRSVSRRRLLQGSAAAAPAILTLVSTPVRATYYTSPASSFASINTSRPRNTHTVNGCKPGWWVNCALTSWPASCKDASGNPKKFKDCFADHATYGNKTLKECMQLPYDTGMDGMVKHLCAAYLNAASAKVPYEVCSMPYARGIWTSYMTKGFHEPTLGVKWYCDSCTPAGNGGVTPWLKTTMPFA